MARSKVFLDANVIIEILESRPKHEQAISVITNPKNLTCVSVLTCHIAAYVSERRLGLELIEKFLQDHKILDVTKDDFYWATKNRKNADFEDALQIAVAVRTGCSVFCTLDGQLAKCYNNLPTLKIRLLK